MFNLKNKLITSCLCIITLLLSINSASAQCKTGWLYGKTVTIDNTSGSTDKDSTSKRIVINTSTIITAGKMNSSGNDIRFVTPACDELNYWIESGINTANTVIWVRTPPIAKNDSVQLQMLYGNSSATAKSKFDLVFPNKFILNSGTQTLNGTYTYDYFEVKSGATINMGTDTILRIYASYIKMDGTIFGYGKGYLAPTSCIDGRGPGGASRGGCNNGGGGGYGGQGGCPPSSGAPSCSGSKSSTYGTNNGFDIAKGSSGSLGGGTTGDRAGDGGGAVVLDAEYISISGTINMNGENGLARSSSSYGGGGGAGGGILLMTRYINHNSSNFTADGGLAGNSYGASGGGGRIKIFYEESTSGTANLSVDGLNDHAYTGSPLTLRESDGVGADGTTYNAKTSINEKPDVIIRNEKIRASITTSAITGTDFCSFETVNVNFSITGLYNSGNKFIVQLSDNTGSFSSPTNIGEITSTTASTIKAVIPGTVSAGTAYRMRVVSTSPVVEGSDNGKDFALNSGITPKFSFSRVCQGNSTSFIDVSTIQSGTITGIAYDFDSDGTYEKTGLNSGSATTYIYANPGKYTVTIEVTGSNGCKVKGYDTVTVDALPSVAFTATNQCIGDSTIFTDLSSITIGSITSIDFDFNSDGVYEKTGISPLSTIKHLFNTPGTKDVTLRVNTNRGCSSTLLKKVYVDPYPSPDFSINSATCIGDTVLFEDLSSTTSGTITSIDYDFDSDGIYDLTGTSPLAITKRYYDTLASTTVVIRATTALGCSNTSAKSVNIYDKASADFITLKECKNTAVVFTDKSTLGTGNIASVDYDFDYDGTYDKTGLNAGTSTSYTYTTDGLKDIGMKVTTDNGCITTLKKTIRINPDPVPDFLSSEECAGNATIFKDTSSISRGLISKVDFDFDNDGTYDITGLGAGAITSYVYPAAGPKDVTIRATSDKGCQVAYTKAFSITKAVSVNPNPSGAFSNTISCFGDSTRFIDLSTISSGTIATTQFDFNGDGVYDQTIANSGDTIYATLPIEGVNKVGILTISDKGCLTLASQNVSVYASPVPTFTVSGQCEGQKTEFINSTALAYGSIASVDYDFDNDGLFDTSGVSASDTVSYQYNSFGIKNIVMRAISDQGCISTATRKLNYSPLPDIDFSFSNTCLGKNAQFYDSSSIALGSIKNYYWSMGDGGDSRLKNATNIYNAEGNYTVELIVESDNACFDTLTQSITVYPQPTANFSFTNICEDELATFKNSSSIKSGILLSSWNFDNGNSSSLSNPSQLFDEDGRFSVQLVVQSTFGCADSINKSLVVYQKPTAGFSVNDACLGTAADYKNSSIAAKSYIWNFGDASSPNTSANPSYTFASTGSYNSQLVAISAQGCSDTLTKTIEVNANPIAAFSVADACFGTQNKFINSSTGASTYNWSFGDGGTSTLANPSRLYNRADTFDISLIAITDKACTDTAFGIAVSNPLPSFNLTASQACTYDSLSFTAKGSDLNTVSWSFGDGIGTSTQLNPKYLYATDGSYTVQFKATSAESCVDSATVTANVLAVPTANFSIKNVCLGDASSFINASKISKGNINSTWDFGDTKGTSYISNPSYTYSQDGKYYVHLTITSDNGCIDTITKSTDIYELPTASFTVNNICIDDDLAPSNQSSGATKYYWSFGDGSSSISANPSHFYKASGTYSIALSSENSFGCKTTTQKSILVYNKPNAAFSTVNNCNKDFSSFSNLSTGANAYSWNFGDATGTSTDKNPKYLYASAGLFDVELIATNAEGCKDTVENPITIYVKPDAIFTVSAACFGQANSFTNFSRNANTFVWQMGNGISFTSTSPSYTYSKDGIYDVQLIAKSSDGCADTANANATVNPLPKLAYTVNDVCFGDSSFFTNATTGATSYQWKFGDANTSSDQNSFNVYSSAAAYQTTLIATTDKSCVDSLSKTHHVFALPKPNFSFNDVCLGQAHQFVNTTNANLNSTNWKFGNGNSSSLNNPSIMYSADGAYQVVLVTTDNNGCTDSISKTATVYPLPQPAFTASNVCLEQETEFTNNSSISSGSIVTFNWNFGDGDYSTDTHPKHEYFNPVNYYASLEAESNFGCKATYTQNIEVYPLPIADFSVAPICFKNPSNFTEQIVSKTAIDSIYWQFGDGSDYLGSVPKHIYQSNGNFNVNLRVVTQQGCISEATGEAVVLEKPVADFTVDEVCFVEYSRFTNTSTLNSSNTWQFGDDNGYSQNISPSYQYLNAGTYPVTLIVTSNDNCKDTITKNAIVNPNPVANFSVDNVCDGEEISPVNSSIGTISSYSWNFGDGNTADGENVNHKYVIHGDYDISLKVITDKNCTDSVIRLVNIYELPNILITNDTTISKGNTVELIASGGNSYSWSPSNSLNNANNATVMARPLEKTTYNLVVENEFSCAAEASVTVDVNSDFYFEVANLFTPDANGYNDVWVIKNMETYSNCQVVVFDKNGREVYSSKNYMNNWDGTLNGKPLPDDAYYYVIDCNNGERIYKGTVTILRTR